MSRYISTSKEEEQMLHDYFLDFIKRGLNPENEYKRLSPEEVAILPEVISIFVRVF